VDPVALRQGGKWRDRWFRLGGPDRIQLLLGQGEEGIGRVLPEFAGSVEFPVEFQLGPQFRLAFFVIEFREEFGTAPEGVLAERGGGAEIQLVGAGVSGESFVGRSQGLPGPAVEVGAHGVCPGARCGDVRGLLPVFLREGEPGFCFPGNGSLVRGERVRQGTDAFCLCGDGLFLEQALVALKQIPLGEGSVVSGHGIILAQFGQLPKARGGFLEEAALVRIHRLCPPPRFGGVSHGDAAERNGLRGLALREPPLESGRTGAHEIDLQNLSVGQLDRDLLGDEDAGQNEGAGEGAQERDHEEPVAFGSGWYSSRHRMKSSLARVTPGWSWCPIRCSMSRRTRRALSSLPFSVRMRAVRR